MDISKHGIINCRKIAIGYSEIDAKGISVQSFTRLFILSTVVA